MIVDCKVGLPKLWENRDKRGGVAAHSQFPNQLQKFRTACTIALKAMNWCIPLFDREDACNDKRDQ